MIAGNYAIKCDKWQICFRVPPGAPSIKGGKCQKRMAIGSPRFHSMSMNNQPAKAKPKAKARAFSLIMIISQKRPEPAIDQLYAAVRERAAPLYTSVDLNNLQIRHFVNMLLNISSKQYKNNK